MSAYSFVGAPVIAFTVGLAKGLAAGLGCAVKLNC